MAVNEEGRQIEIATELSATAKTLAHSTRSVPNPSESYELLILLRATQDSLAQVYAQLAAWHREAADGTHFSGEDERSIPEAPAVGQNGRATPILEKAAALATATADLIDGATEANGVVRWFDQVKEQI